MTRAAVFSLALILAGLASASPALACDGDACSNDRLGILGDERLVWDPVVEWGLDEAGGPAAPGQYEVWREGDVQACDVVPPAQTFLDVFASNCIIPNGEHRLYVRACNALGVCGQFGGPVGFLTYACARTTACVYSADDDARNDSCPACEDACYAGAPRRLSHLPTCEEPNP